MNTKTLKSLAVAALIAGNACAQAQTAAAPAPSSPAKKELVAKLMQIQRPGVEMLAMQVLQQPVGRLMQGAASALQQVPTEKREAAAKAIEADVKKFVEDNSALIKDKAVKLAPVTLGPMLEERFTEEELRQLVTWLESPTSKKFSQFSGEMTKAMQDKLLADAGPTLEPRFNTLQQGIAKHLGVAPPPAGASKPAPAPAPKK